MSSLKPVLLALSLLGTPPLLTAQVKPVPAHRLDASVGTRAAQYFTDLNQRLREVYQAPGDGRAISLLSSTITEFTARKKGLLTELEQPKPSPQTAASRRPSAAQAQEQETILTGSAAAKMAARRQRNPALESAFRHFDQAQLTTLEAFRAADQ